MVSIFDELFSSHKKVLKKLIIEIREEYAVPGLEETIKEIENLKNSAYYERLYGAVRLWWRIVADEGTFTKEENQKIRLLVLASQNLRKFSLRPSVVDYETFKTLYSFLEYFYYMNSGERLTHEDEMNVYFSGLDERIVFAQDKFDKIEEIREPTDNFFKKLSNVKWQDKGVDNFFDKLDGIMFHSIHSLFGDELLSEDQFSFYSIQSGFLQLISACSAVTNGRNEINEKDVLKAYKTYFKLMKTDTTKYKAIPERIKWLEKQDGYLVCQKCNGYYKLQPGESPEDFEECQCGGKLKYYENIDWLFKKKKIQNR